MPSAVLNVFYRRKRVFFNFWSGPNHIAGGWLSGTVEKQNKNGMKSLFKNVCHHVFRAVITVMWWIQVLLHGNNSFGKLFKGILVQKCVTVVTVYITHSECGSADFSLKDGFMHFHWLSVRLCASQALSVNHVSIPVVFDVLP